jgi:hypothetical protein
VKRILYSVDSTYLPVPEMHIERLRSNMKSTCNQLNALQSFYDCPKRRGELGDTNLPASLSLRQQGYEGSYADSSIQAAGGMCAQFAVGHTWWLAHLRHCLYSNVCID